MTARAQPRWPRTLRARAAADYAGYQSERAWLAAVATGEMPQPFKHGGADAWDIVDIDEYIDALKAGAQRPRRWQEHGPQRV